MSNWTWPPVLGLVYVAASAIYCPEALIGFFASFVGAYVIGRWCV